MIGLFPPTEIMPLFTMVYLPLVDFLQMDKRTYCVDVETFYKSILPHICEPTEASTCDAEGEVLLGVRAAFSVRLSLLMGGLLAFLRIQRTSSMRPRRVPPIYLGLCLVFFSGPSGLC